MIDFDRDKDAFNRSKHGMPLSFAVALFESDYKEHVDDRYDYAETRMVATGLIKGRVCTCVYTWRHNVRRIISLRKANKREINAYQKS